MPPNNKGHWAGIISSVKTPLGFAALVVLVAESVFSFVVSGLPQGPDKSRLIIAMIVLIFLLVGIVFLLAIFKRDALTGIKLPDNYVDEKAKFPAYGLKINKIIWKNSYLANYDFNGEIEYFIENISNISIVDLQHGGAGWFGWDIKCKKFLPKVYGADSGLYSIEKKSFSANESINKSGVFGGNEKKVTVFDWQFKINPPLASTRSLHYGVKIETENTERDAFTEKGSFAGMLTQLPVDSMACELYAPDGYQFINKGFVVRDSGGIDVKNSWCSPEFSENGRKISWSVEKPLPTLQYLIRIVIAERDRK